MDSSMYSLPFVALQYACAEHSGRKMSLPPAPPARTRQDKRITLSKDGLKEAKA